MLFPAAALWWRGGRAITSPGGPTTASAPTSAPLLPNPASLRSRFVSSKITVLLFIWIAAITVFFSFSASKQDLYIYPVMPAVAALGGVAIAASAPGARWVAVMIPALFALVGAGLLYVFQRSANVYDVVGVAPVAIVAMGGGLVGMALAVTGRWHKGLLAFLAAGVLINWILVLRVLPSFEKYKPVPPITRFLEGRLQRGDVVAHYSVALPSMVYYMRRHIDVTYDREAFLAIMRQPARVYGVLWTEEYRNLKDEIGLPTCAIYRRPAFNIKLRAIVEQEQLPELVVITNRCE
jgi:4-amino-4-deoxy-L-arabinose transferase-like glycosyltransferase